MTVTCTHCVANDPCKVIDVLLMVHVLQFKEYFSMMNN